MIVCPNRHPQNEPTARPVTRAAPTLVPEDCIGSDPKALSVVGEGANGWLLTDQSLWMVVVDNAVDANNVLLLARAHTNQCFIGRGNSRPDRRSYIDFSWK